MAFNISLGNIESANDQIMVNALQQSHDIYDWAAEAAKEAVKRIVAANGANSATTQVSVPANAIVDEYLIKIKAARANYVQASLAGEVRQSSSNPLEVVVDFGKMITVNAIRIPYVVTDFEAYSWLGSKFDLDNNASTNFTSRPADAGRASDLQETYVFSQEIRTERLLLVFPDNMSFATIESDLELSLPDLPSDLAISINGGAAVWQYAGMVQPGNANELSEDQWNSSGELLVSLAAPIQALAGDATRSDMLSLTIELSSKTPGDMAVEEYSSNLRLLHRMSFNGEAELKANFSMEGKIPVTLASPEISGVKLHLLGAQLTLFAEFPPERALPAVGAEANGISELVLGNGKAACVRLDNIDELSQISSIRLPLSTPSSRAETRVVLWTGDEFNASEALSEGVSDPQSWSGETEQWLKFDFPEPIDIEDGDIYWVAVIVERGGVCWKLAASDAQEHYPVRLGAPSGPWRALPAIFGSGGLGTVAGRLHVIGLAVEASPLAPIQLSLEGGDDTSLTPTQEGVRVQLDINNPDSAALIQAELAVVSHAVGTLTMKNVDVITKERTV